MAEKIKKREELNLQDTWATEDMFESDSSWEDALLVLQQDKEKLVAFSGILGENGQNLLDYLTLMEDSNERAGLLANYAMRKSDEDTRNAAYQAMTGRLMSILVDLGAATSFETPEIMPIADETLDSFYQAYPGLERYRRYLTDMRRRKEHVLSPAEEKLLASAGEMGQSPQNIYGMFSNADMTFADALDAEGNTHAVTQGTFVSCQESADRVLRKNSYESLYKGFSSFKNTAAGLLNAQNKQLKFFAEARKYPNAFEASLDANNVPTSVYLKLIEAIHANLDKMHRYVRLRKKLLGVDQLHFYDVYASLVGDTGKKYSYEEAKQMVYESVAPMGEAYQKILKEGFENRWIDVYENEGKRSGAYSAGVKVHPYVLLNYNGNLDSVFTLAHEMGHALHSYLSNQTQNPVDSQYVIFVAEVASTLNEALLMEYMLGKTTDKKERACLINHFLEQFKGTIFRQTMFAEFELIMGRKVSEGQTLTADMLCEEYRRLNEMYFGEDMVVDDYIAVEWARIPHFYFDYYVFQYATGYSAAIALSRQILDEGEPAVRRYMEFLSGGCSKSPVDLLKGAGVDMTQPEPVAQALALFDHLLDEMEALLEE